MSATIDTGPSAKKKAAPAKRHLCGTSEWLNKRTPLSTQEPPVIESSSNVRREAPKTTERATGCRTPRGEHPDWRWSICAKAGRFTGAGSSGTFLETAPLKAENVGGTKYESDRRPPQPRRS